MKHIKSNSGEWIAGEGYKKRPLVQGIDLLSNKALVQLIDIPPKTKGRDHYHKKSTEIFYFLGNEGTFIIDDKKIKLDIGDVLVCEKGEIHRADNDSDVPWRYLAFKTDNEKNDCYWM